MRRSTIIILSLAVILSLAGCAGKMPPNTVKSIEDMTGKNIGYVSGTPAAVYAEGYGTLHAYQSGETMLVDVKNGALDCAVMEESAAKSTIRLVPGLKTLKEPLLKDDMHFAIAKENPDLTKAVDAALKTLGDSGVIDKILKGYKSADGFRYKTPADADLSAGTLTLAVVGAFPPYAYDDGSGNIIGIDVDIARAVCDLLHVQMKITLTDRSSLVTTVQYGKADLALGGVNDTEENALQVDFSVPYAQTTQVVIVRK
jgi:polar amino acid transport system substrate-binding protein